MPVMANGVTPSDRRWPLSRWAAAVQVQWALWCGDRAAALSGLSRWLDRWPDCAWALSQRSLLWQALGRPAEALVDARALVQRCPGRHPADAYNLGFLLEAAGQADEAIPAFEAAVAQAPAMDRAWYGLGLAQARLGRLDAARRAWLRCAELQPWAPHPRVQLARLHMRCGEVADAQGLIAELHGFEPAVARQLQAELFPASVAGEGR